MTDKLLSKISFLILLSLIATACSKPTEMPPNAEAPIFSAPATVAPIPSVPAFRLESLSKEQRKGFEKAFPLEARLAFEDANIISITGNIQSNGNAINISSSSEKRVLLDSLYIDLAKSIRPMGPDETSVGCKEMGPVISNSKPWPDTVTISISYTCGWFDLRSQNLKVSTLFRSRSGLSRPLIRDLFRRENRPDPQLEMP